MKKQRYCTIFSWMTAFSFLGLLGFVIYLLHFRKENNCTDNDIQQWEPPSLLDLSIEAYNAKRDSLVKQNEAMYFDSDITLSNDEMLVDRLMSHYRIQALNQFQNGSVVPIFPSQFYFPQIKSFIEQTDLFKVFQKMPKGGLLHVHTSSLGNVKYFIENITYREDCYVQTMSNTSVPFFHITFFNTSNGILPYGYVSTQKYRENNSTFDDDLKSWLTFSANNAPNKQKGYIWDYFESCINRVIDALNYLPVFIDYYTQAFTEYINDGVQYIELRAVLSPLYDLQGNKYNESRVIEYLIEIRNNLRTKYPQFDLKVILCGIRFESETDVWTQLVLFMDLYKQFPDVIIGIDFVGEEDRGHTTRFYTQVFLDFAKNQSVNGIIPPIPYLFHDGESDSTNNSNLIDAFLFNTSRVGHGFNLVNFPFLEKVARERGIAFEICPLSNQLLHFVDDIRIHPANGYFRRGVPIVISNDDPGVFTNHGLGYDLWSIFMGWNLNLKEVKKLLLNSLTYSRMNQVDKTNALYFFNQRWNEFIGNYSRNSEYD